MKYKEISNLRSQDISRYIDCDILLEDGTSISFTASPDDTERHGVEIYNVLLAGAFGEVSISPSDGGEYEWEGEQWILVRSAQAIAISKASDEVAKRVEIATGKITNLEYAVELDMLEEGDAENLKAWKKYKLLLSRIDTNAAPDITWPEAPQ